MSDGKRLFFGARVSVACANALAQCAETLARRARDANVDVRWLAPTSYHVTLKYLGWTRADAIPAVRDAAAAALVGATPMRFRAARLGAFPSLEKASVIWAGVEGTAPPIGELAARLERAMIGIGFAAEPRPFAAHITLGRLHEARPVREVVLPLSEQMFSDTRIDFVSLYESEIKPAGSVYKEISRIDLNSPVSSEKRQTGALQLTDEPEEPETDDGWPRGEPMRESK